MLVGLHRHQRGVVVLRLFAVHRQPAGVDQHLAVGLEMVARHLRDAGGDHEFSRRVKHRDEALDHQVIQLGLDLAEAFWRLQRGDDGKVVGHLAVVKHPLGLLDVAGIQALAGMLGQAFQRAGQILAGNHLEGLLDGGQVVLGQRTAVGTRVGQHLVFFVQRLGQAERGLGTEAEAAVGLPLQRGQVVEQRAGGRAGLGFFGHRAGFAQHRVADGIGVACVPQPVGAAVGVGQGVGSLTSGCSRRRPLLELGVKPLAVVSPGGRRKAGLDLPIVARNMFADLLLTLDHDGQRGRLHPAHGGQEKPAVP